MWRYVLKRLLWLIPVILSVSILIFTIMYFVPGDPASISLGQSATPEQIEMKQEEMGLNEPYIVQLGSFLKSVFLELDFGESYFSGTNVSADIIQRLPRTLAISFFSMVLAILIGVPLGITAAVHQNSLRDNFSMLASLAGVSIPSFWLALLLVMLFSLQLGWLPASGIDTPAHYVLPVIACAVGGASTLARQTRSSMLEVIRADYIATARAKGQTERKVIYRHALRNALIPIVTVSGAYFGNMMAGALVIETVFSIPGLGLYMTQGLNKRDYPVVRGSIIVTALIFSLVMLLVDLIYAVVDPRIRAQYSAHKAKKKVKGEAIS